MKLRVGEWVSGGVLAALIVVAGPLAADTVTDRAILTVNQKGEINKTNVVAKASQMAANQVKADIALAKAEAAAGAAEEATNTLNDVVKQIGENEVVLYRQGYTDSLGLAVVLPEDTKCRITYYAANTGVRASDGYIQHTLRYATTENADDVPAGIKAASPLVDLKDFTALDSSLVDPKTRLSGTYEYAGETYPYVYEVCFYLPPGQQAFAIVYLDADDAEVDGTTFLIENGIAGGLSLSLRLGDKILIFTGGLLTGVADVVDL